MNTVILSPPSQSCEILNKMASKRSYFASKPQPSSQFGIDIEDDLQDSDTQPRKSPDRSDANGNLIQNLEMKQFHHLGLRKRTQSIIRLQRGFRGSQKSGFSLVWKHGALRIIYLITRFLQVVKTSTAQYKFRLINKKIMTIINDSTADFQYYQLQELIHDRPGKLRLLAIKLLTKMMPNISLKFPILMPDSQIRFFFDLLVLIVITVNLFYIPMRLSFQLNGFFSVSEVKFIFDQLPSIVFILDIVLKFMTPYFEGGVIHEQFKDIANHYIKGELFTDFLVVVPFIFQTYQTRYLDFLLLLRVFKITKIVENIEDSSSIREKYATPLDLTKLVFILIFVSHMCACVWNFIGDLELEQGIQDAWLVRYHMELATWESRYITSFYWSTITTLTVGYGDLVPGNDIERLTCSSLVLICSIVFGYTISRIGSIFAQMTENNQRYKDTMAQLNSYVKKRKLNKQLQTKVKKYLEYLFMSDQYKNEECESLMERLSLDLKREVKIDIYMPLLRGNQILCNNFSEPMLQSLCACMHTKRYAPGEMILEQEKPAEQLNFIISGQVEAFVQSPSQFTNLRRYQKGFALGLKQFLGQERIPYSSRAIQFVEIAILGYEDFKRCLKAYPEELQKYQIMKDNLQFNPYYKNVNEACQVCAFNHHLHKCPFVFFQVNKLKVLSHRGEQAERCKCVRRSKQRVGTLEFLRKVQQDLINLMIDKQFVKEEELNKSFEKQLGLQKMNSLSHNQVGLSESEQLIQNNEANESMIPKPLRIQKKRSSVIEDFLKQSTKGRQVPQEIEQVCIDEVSEEHLKSMQLIDQMRCLSKEFNERIREDTIPGLDQFCNFNIYYKHQNLAEQLQKLSQQLEGQRKFQRKYKRSQKEVIISPQRFHPQFRKSSGMQSNTPLQQDSSDPQVDFRDFREPGKRESQNQLALPQAK